MIGGFPKVLCLSPVESIKSLPEVVKGTAVRVGLGMYLRTLGGLELTASKLTRPKPLLLLTYLVLEGAKDRRHLSELFYPGTENPLAGLRVALKHIREDASGTLVTEDSTVSAAVAADALDLLKAAEQRDPSSLVELYEGPFLDGFYLHNWSSELEEWVLGTREYLAALVRQALLTLGEAAAAQGDLAATASYAERAYLLPGVPPLTPEQLELMHELLSAGKSPYMTTLRKEMEDLGMPLRLVEAAPDGTGARLFPAGAGDTPNNLKTSPTAFVGRDEELKTLTRHLDEPQNRLLTLVGAGGVGKTRLALEMARVQLERAHWQGAYFVALDTVSDAALIPQSIAQALAYRLPGRDPPLDELLAYIGQDRLLLVLDNYEQLIEGRSVVARLVDDCPNTSVIVTSRERLNLAAEGVYALAGLPVPADTDVGLAKIDEAGTLASVRLFVQRARRVALTFQLTPETAADVVAICRTVEGSPLGIELAAAWVGMMPLGDIANELSVNLGALEDRHRDTPERHKSLRAAFEHSWQLLNLQDQATLKRLAVFRGGFRREAAAEVVNASIPRLASFIEKSLIRVLPSGRYDRHLLLYQFSAEKLAQDGDEKQLYEARHANYYVLLAEQAEAQLRSETQGWWLARLEEEAANFQAALSWAVQNEPILSLRLASALGLYWYVVSSFEEGCSWFDKVLAQPELPPTALYAKTLYGAGRLARSHGDFTQARARLVASLALYQQLNDAAGAAKCLSELGILAAVQADDQAATALFEQGCALASEAGDEETLGILYLNLGLSHALAGRLSEATRLNEESLALRRKRGDRRAVAHTLANLALIALRQNDYARAHNLYDESFDLGRSLDNKGLMAEVLLGKAAVKNLTGEHAHAQVLITKGLELYLEQQDRLGVIDALMETASLAADRAALVAARLWGAVDVSRTKLNFPLRPFSGERYTKDLCRARAQVSDDLFSRAWAEGELWSLDEAAAQALAWLAESQS